jgi:hypothetical protein
MLTFYPFRLLLTNHHRLHLHSFSLWKLYWHC